MKIKQPVFLFLIFLLLISGIFAVKNAGNRNINGEIPPVSEGKKETVGTGLLYNPPPGGNPENNDRILFCSDPSDTENADYHLYTIRQDGSGKMKLPDFGKSMRHPAWSPERSRIAYSADADNEDKIFIMTVDGKENKQLTFGDSRDMFPAWSPDGKYIAYISYRNNTPNLFVVDIYGKNTRQLTFAGGKDTVLWPSWSPASDVIAYAYNKDGEDIGFRLRTVKPDGTGTRELPSPEDSHLGDLDPAWSPDGNTLYFLSNRSRYVEIWKLDYDKFLSFNTETDKPHGNDIGLKQISNLHSVNVSPDHRPRVSKDGEKIVFYGVGSDWQNIGTNLYTLNTDGSGLANITKSTDDDEWPDW